MEAQKEGRTLGSHRKQGLAGDTERGKNFKKTQEARTWRHRKREEL